MDIATKIQEYYNIFKGLPSTNPIVRQSQFNDAFEIVVFDLLFRAERYRNSLSVENITELEKWIVPAPDDTIDIFYEEEDGDEYKYHIVQVKNTILAEADFKVCFSSMKRTIDTYLNAKKDIKENLRSIISDSNFDLEHKNECTYYVVHRGSKDTFKGQSDNEIVVTNEHLETVLRSVQNFCVPFEKIKVDQPSNFLDYDNSASTTSESYKACVCNINGFELAKLCNKYNHSDLGRNILFGQNLREALSKGSKTFDGMCKTIDNEPQNFWYYNNGITIIAESYDLKVEDEVEYVHLTNFSIINGAQTTSALAKYLKDSDRDGEPSKKARLREVYVAARIVETKENNELRANITIFNNTQNPITTRDMISNNDEQKLLYERFIEGAYPNIFIQVRTGQQKPRYKMFQRHQIIANNDLGQLVFASYLSSPFSAKDKKNTLFNKDNSSTEFTVNKDYHMLFNYDKDISKCGILFKKSKEEINELLFIKYLHNKAKKYLKDIYDARLDKSQLDITRFSVDSPEYASAIRSTDLYNKLKQINNINTFYNISLYYEFKRQFDELCNAQSKLFDYDKFYNKSTNYENEIVKTFAELFNSETIELIKDLGYADPSKFVRAKPSQDEFFRKLSDKLAMNIPLFEKYKYFIEKFKK